MTDWYCFQLSYLNIFALVCWSSESIQGLTGWVVVTFITKHAGRRGA